MLSYANGQHRACSGSEARVVCACSIMAAECFLRRQGAPPQRRITTQRLGPALHIAHCQQPTANNFAFVCLVPLIAGGAPTEVLNYLVAEDFFAACGEEARRMVPAVVAAVKRWAGPDQAQALSLSEWLYHRVASLAAFMPASWEQQQHEQHAGAAGV